MKLFDVYPLFDIVPVRAEGSLVWDEKQTQYLDLYGGHAVISIGHSHPHYVKAITEQLQQIGFYSNSVKIPQQEVLAEKLAGLCGYPEYQLFLINSGAEANENALKAASFVTGRKKVISFTKGWHGRTSAAVGVTDDAPIIAPINQNPHAIMLPFGDEDALNHVEQPEEVCAVIIEGIQGISGINIPTPAFLQKIRAFCDRHGSLMILDEIQSGYGRSGKFFAHQYADVQPDLITMAKGMGNGFPIGGLLLRPRIQARHGMLGTTFGGNYLACAAAIAVLEVMQQENLIENAATVGTYIMERLRQEEGIVEVRGQGLMIGIELPGPAAPLRKELLENYHIFTGSSSNKNVLRILPALNLREMEADRFLTAYKLAQATINAQ